MYDCTSVHIFVNYKLSADMIFYGYLDLSCHVRVRCAIIFLSKQFAQRLKSFRKVALLSKDERNSGSRSLGEN